MLLKKVYPLLKDIGTTTITKSVINSYVNKFWLEIFKPIHTDKNSQVHLSLSCKVNFEGEMGYRSLGLHRKVNIEDKKLYALYILNYLSKLDESYVVTPVSELEFNYIIHDGVADDSRLLLKQPNFEFWFRV